MDATALRWILAIIGVVVILGVYLFSIYQGKMRRNASIKTFTQEELQSGVIEDETLSNELSNINTMLENDLVESDIEDIKINPALDAKVNKTSTEEKPVELPQPMFDIAEENRVALVLKAEDGRVLTSSEVSNAFQHAQLELQDDGFVTSSDDDYIFASLTTSGSLAGLNDAEFYCYGLMCYFDYSKCEQPTSCYEMMLKKIDELVRILDLKVYSEQLELLTLQHVNDTRARLNPQD